MSTSRRDLPERLMADPGSATKDEIRILAAMTIARMECIKAILDTRPGDSAVVVMLDHATDGGLNCVLTFPSVPDEEVVQRAAEFSACWEVAWRDAIRDAADMEAP